MSYYSRISTLWSYWHWLFSQNSRTLLPVLHDTVSQPLWCIIVITDCFQPPCSPTLELPPDVWNISTLPLPPLKTHLFNITYSVTALFHVTCYMLFYCIYQVSLSYKIGTDTIQLLLLLFHCYFAWNRQKKGRTDTDKITRMTTDEWQILTSGFIVHIGQSVLLKTEYRQCSKHEFVLRQNSCNRHSLLFPKTSSKTNFLCIS